MQLAAFFCDLENSPGFQATAIRAAGPIPKRCWRSGPTFSLSPSRLQDAGGIYVTCLYFTAVVFFTVGFGALSLRLRSLKLVKKSFHARLRMSRFNPCTNKMCGLDLVTIFSLDFRDAIQTFPLRFRAISAYSFALCR